MSALRNCVTIGFLEFSISRRDPTSSITPSASIAIMCEIAKTLGISRLTMTPVKPKRLCVLAIRSCMLFAKSGSKPVVGSSNRTISGSWTRARARPARKTHLLQSLHYFFFNFSFAHLGFFLKGKATLSNRLKESSRAAPWNRTPNLLRMRLSPFCRTKKGGIL